MRWALLQYLIRMKVIGVVVAATVAVALGIASMGTVANGAQAQQGTGNACAPNTPTQLVASACTGPPSPDPRQWPNVSAQAPGISESRAVAIAQAFASQTGSSTAPTTKQAQMTYSQASQALNDSANPTVAADTEVWVVTVYAPFAYQLAPPGATVSTQATDFTLTLDASNGSPIDACSGCSAFG